MSESLLFRPIAAWTPMSGQNRWPSLGTVDEVGRPMRTYDLHSQPYIGGVIGLNPSGDVSRGVITFFWTFDAVGEHIVGTQGMHIASPIPSMAELRLLNRGPFVYMTYQAFSGTNGLSATMFSTDVGGPQPLMCGDTILIEDIDQPVVANATKTIYPCDYFAGQVGVYFDAPPAARATIYGVNLTNDNRKVDVISPGSAITIVPVGTWFVVVWNPTPAPIRYTLAMVPLLT
jgi:hypothetical protein